MLLTSHRSFASLLPEQFQRLQRELHSSLVDFQNGLNAAQGVHATNIWSKPGELLMRLELPGFGPEQVSVEIEDNQVAIETQPADGNADVKWMRQEREQKAGKRGFRVPFKIDAAASTASFERGILELKLVALQPNEPVKLNINGQG